MEFTCLKTFSEKDVRRLAALSSPSYIPTRVRLSTELEDKTLPIETQHLVVDPPMSPKIHPQTLKEPTRKAKKNPIIKDFVEDQSIVSKQSAKSRFQNFFDVCNEKCMVITLNVGNFVQFFH